MGLIFAQYPLASELCWSDQGVGLYSVRSRMQERWGDVATRNVSGVGSIEETSCGSSEKGQGRKEASEQGPEQAGTGEEGTS